MKYRTGIAVGIGSLIAAASSAPAQLRNRMSPGCIASRSRFRLVRVGFSSPMTSARTEFGKLRFIGGLSLSGGEFFGGFSGLAVSADGRRLFAISDAGFWMSARSTMPTAVPSASPMPSRRHSAWLTGSRSTATGDRDAEAVSLALARSTTARIALDFERHDRLTVFPVSADGWAAAALAETSRLRCPAEGQPRPRITRHHRCRTAQWYSSLLQRGTARQARLSAAG